LRAAQQLLADGGPGAVTMEGVAALAGVSKPTVYRWWPDRHSVAMAALMDAQGERKPPRSRHGSIDMLRQQLNAISKRFATATGRHVATMIAAADADSELSKAFRTHFVLARRTEGRVLLERAMLDGEIRRGIDLEVVLDVIYGPLFFRLLLGHAPLDEHFPDRVLDHVLRGLAR
jgi:AcrR family transcriptional regulator